MTTFHHLFTPARIGTLELRNRIVMAPMTVDYANPDETPSEKQIAYYAERARGGAGLITLEVCTVDPDHRYQRLSLGLHSDHLIEPHRKLVDAIHAHGAKVFPQIAHTEDSEALDDRGFGRIFRGNKQSFLSATARLDGNRQDAFDRTYCAR